MNTDLLGCSTPNTTIAPGTGDVPPPPPLKPQPQRVRDITTGRELSVEISDTADGPKDLGNTERAIATPPSGPESLHQQTPLLQQELTRRQTQIPPPYPANLIQIRAPAPPLIT